MEVTRDNLKYAYEHIKREWEFYWEQSKGNPRWIFKREIWSTFN